jgi:hypothetical protein
MISGLRAEIWTQGLPNTIRSRSVTHWTTTFGGTAGLCYSMANVRCRRRGERMHSSYSFTSSALNGLSGQRHAPAALYSRRRSPSIYCTGGWLGSRAGLDTEAEGKILLLLRGIKPRSPCRPARSQTLYWLSYHGSYITAFRQKKVCSYRCLNHQAFWGLMPVHQHWNCHLRLTKYVRIERLIPSKESSVCLWKERGLAATQVAPSLWPSYAWHDCTGKEKGRCFDLTKPVLLLRTENVTVVC